ncbi:MAG: ice-binding family protein [Sulfuricaulis sp.]|nr:ice-binding family protein [Sulfuricaulis sp.]
MWFAALLLSAFVAGCGGGGGSASSGAGAGSPAAGSPAAPGSGPGPAGAPPAAIIPGAACTAAAGATIPTVTLSDPTSGNQFVTTSTNGVAGNGKLITATFSLAMDPATINSSPAGTLLTFTLKETTTGNNVPGTVAMNAANTIATLTTSSALSVDTSYTAIITQGAKSAAGTAIACSYAWNFKTVTSVATGLAPVNLGLAAPFGTAATAGITNTATAPLTQINGDVVLDPNTTCNAVTVDNAGGFGLCGSNGSTPTINGTVISPLFPDAGTTSGAVKSDLNAAYNSITKANLPGAIVLGCGTIGSGGGGGAGPGCPGVTSTLPPGVYISNTGSSIGVTGVLTLDGQGDVDSRFIFQAPSSTLTTAAGAPEAPGSEIKLINGAKASNVFWQVGSSATIGTYAIFQGNVLADTSITMGTGSKSCGRLLAGAVKSTGKTTFDSNVVSVPGHVKAHPTCKK